MLYSQNGHYPNTLPFRIKLSNGRTRTDPTSFTPEELADVGLVAVENPPTLTEHQTLSWNNVEWVVYTKTPEEVEQEHLQKISAQWQSIREIRDQLMADFDWRYTRNARETRLALPLTDTLQSLDEYMQLLADITSQVDPFNIAWPIEPTKE